MKLCEFERFSNAGLAAEWWRKKEARVRCGGCRGSDARRRWRRSERGRHSDWRRGWFELGAVLVATGGIGEDGGCCPDECSHSICRHEHGGGRGMLGETMQSRELQRCSTVAAVFDEGATGGCFLECATVAGRGRGDCGVGWWGREREREEFKVRVLVV
ncbi:hypothetical protein DEO72_LG2g3713 [Vigna unguiculata]|uniref:Uncharacterized protein n=1 Tax=Vigna unguiculata TaxID=3917 RepID=A0A4D6L4F8_VIGUN|nr:hypothetical protein DEO72_LG2g3712 [Vigna unguiculata]QCD83369.1 hypothetical protein DEO72_LG2g3713 [Vigna unguiculata]